MACSRDLDYGDIVPIDMEIFDFDIESNSDDEVFFGEVGFTEQCITYELNNMCNVEPLPEFTTAQWKEMERDAYKVVAAIRESQKKCNESVNEVLLIGTPSLTQRTRLKRKLQSLNLNSIKQSPLLDITNQSNTRSNKVSILHNSNSKFDVNCLDFSPIIKNGDPNNEQLGLVKPVCLNFDDVEPSPKRIRCFNAFMSPGKDFPLLINETCEGLYMNSPTAGDVVPLDFKLHESNLENSIKTPKRKSQCSNQARSVNKSSTTPTVKEPCTPESLKKKIFSTPIDEVKRSRNSILNMSFTVDKDKCFLKKLGDPELMKTPRVKVSKMLVTNSGSLVASGKKSEKVLTHKIAGKHGVKGLRSLENENLSFVESRKVAKLTATGNDEMSFCDNIPEIRAMLKQESIKIGQNMRKMVGHKHLQNEKNLVVRVSETDNNTLLIEGNKPSSVVEGSTPSLTDSFVKSTPIESAFIRGSQTVLNESFSLVEMKTPTLTELVADKTTKTSLPRSLTVESKKLNESFTVESKKPLLDESFTVESNKPLLNESFTVESKKPLLNESFTVESNKPLLNESFTVESNKPPLNESFTVDSKKPLLNESFTVESNKPLLNESFTVETKKPLLNESFPVENKEPTLNKSFTVENKKPALNDSFIVESEKPLLNELFAIGGNEVISNELPVKEWKSNVRKFSSQAANMKGTTKRTSLSGAPTKNDKLIKDNCTSDHQNLQDKSISKTNNNPLKKPVRTVPTTTSRKRPLDSSRQSLVYSKVDTKANKNEKTFGLENNVTSNLIQNVPSKMSYNVKIPDMSFDKSSNIPKDEHGMVKFQEKSNTIVKKTKSSLVLPRNKVLKKPVKDSTTAKSTGVGNSPSSNIKRKCLMSTPVLDRSLISRIPAPNSKEEVKSKLVPPIKLQLPLKPLDCSKLNVSSQVLQKGPVKAIHKPLVKTSEKIPAPVSSTRSKLPMPSRSRIPQMK